MTIIPLFCCMAMTSSFPFLRFATFSATFPGGKGPIFPYIIRLFRGQFLPHTVPHRALNRVHNAPRFIQRFFSEFDVAFFCYCGVGVAQHSRNCLYTHPCFAPFCCTGVPEIMSRIILHPKGLSDFLKGTLLLLIGKGLFTAKHESIVLQRCQQFKQTIRQRNDPVASNCRGQLDLRLISCRVNHRAANHNSLCLKIKIVPAYAQHLFQTHSSIAQKRYNAFLARRKDVGLAPTSFSRAVWPYDGFPCAY